MKHKPNILVVGSFVLDQIATTSVFPAEGETVLGSWREGRKSGGAGQPAGRGCNYGRQDGLRQQRGGNAERLP